MKKSKTKIIDETEENIFEKRKNADINNSVSNKLELIKFTSQVDSRIKTDIGSDYVLAKLDEQKKEGITEFTSSAYFFKRIANMVKTTAKKWEYKYNENTQEYEWRRRYLNTLEKAKIDKASNITFDTYMVRPNMTVILNRNQAGNVILNKLSQTEGNETEEEDENTNKVLERIKSISRPSNEI